MSDILERVAEIEAALSRGRDAERASTVKPDDARWLCATVRELKTDAARLDWLDSQRGDEVSEGPHGEQVLHAHSWGVYGLRADVRGAIDAELVRAGSPRRREEVARSNAGETQSDPTPTP